MAKLRLDLELARTEVRMLGERDRVWVKIPGKGFVSVGRVAGPRVPASEFRIDGQPALDVLQSMTWSGASTSCRSTGSTRFRRGRPCRRSECSATRTRSASRSLPRGVLPSTALRSGLAWRPDAMSFRPEGRIGGGRRGGRPHLGNRTFATAFRPAFPGILPRWS